MVIFFERLALGHIALILGIHLAQVGPLFIGPFLRIIIKNCSTMQAHRITNYQKSNIMLVKFFFYFPLYTRHTPHQKLDFTIH